MNLNFILYDPIHNQSNIVTTKEEQEWLTCEIIR